MKEYNILKPKKLNLEGLVAKYKPDFDFNFDFAYFFINNIIKETQFTFKDESICWECFSTNHNVKNHFISRKSDISQFYNSFYKKHIEFLLQNFPNDGRVLWGRRYSLGQSFGYQLSPYYFNTELEIYKITDGRLLKKIAKRELEPKIDNTVKKKYNFFINYFDKSRLTVHNTPTAMELLFNNFLETKNLQKYISNANQLLNVMNGKFSFDCKPRIDGRLYTAITNFPSILRQFLRYDEKILGEVDLSSSIPFFLYYVLNSVIKGNITEVKSRINNPNLIHYMLRKNVETLDITEVEYFGKIIIQNKLYELFIDDFSNIHRYGDNINPDTYLFENFKKEFFYPLNPENPDDLKKFAKKRILSMLFAKPCHYLIEQEIFKHHFPTILLFLNKYKKTILKELKGKGQHKKISYLGFQLESDLMLNHIARSFNNHYKRKKLIMSLHDCLITTKENVPLLESFMRDKFFEQLGFAPSLKVKYWEETVMPLLPFSENKLSA